MWHQPKRSARAEIGEPMKKLAWLVCFCTTLAFAAPQSTSPTHSSFPGSKLTIEGLVRDIAWPIQNGVASATYFDRKCAIECARQGSPLIILTSKGELYVPISDSMPDKDQHAKLEPFVGKYVRTTGIVFERSGTRAIAITEIREMKNVHLTTDAK